MTHDIPLTSEPLPFLDYLSEKNKTLYEEVSDLIVFEEISAGRFRLQKLYKEGVWNRKNERTLDALWLNFCSR